MISDLQVCSEPNRGLQDWVVEGCSARALHWGEEEEEEEPDSNYLGEEDSFRLLSSRRCSRPAHPLLALLEVSLELEVCSELHTCTY